MLVRRATASPWINAGASFMGDMGGMGDGEAGGAGGAGGGSGVTDTLRYPDELLPMVDHFERIFSDLAAHSSGDHGSSHGNSSSERSLSRQTSGIMKERLHDMHDVVDMDPVSIAECNRMILGLQALSARVAQFEGRCVHHMRDLLTGAIHIQLRSCLDKCVDPNHDNPQQQQQQQQQRERPALEQQRRDVMRVAVEVAHSLDFLDLVREDINSMAETAVEKLLAPAAVDTTIKVQPGGGIAECGALIRALDNVDRLLSLVAADLHEQLGGAVNAGGIFRRVAATQCAAYVGGRDERPVYLSYSSTHEYNGQ